LVFLESQGDVAIMEEMLEISFDLVGKTLEQDIYSELNILLLKKGTVLTETNILLLKKHDYKSVKVSEKVTFEKLYKKNIDRISDLFSSYNNVEEVSLDAWFEEDEKLFQFIVRNPSLTEDIYSTHKGEASLYRHSANVGIIAVIIGKVLGYSRKNLKILWKMGILHDIGKMKLSTDLLRKHGDLSKIEESEYQKHTYYGWNLFKVVNDIDVNILNAIKYHHEKIDGSGHPKGLKVNEIPLMVQMISVADLFDKLSVSEEMTSIFQVMNQLINETQQNQLNPAIVIPLIRYKFMQKVGKDIILSDGRKAKIIFIHENEPNQPLVNIIETDEYIDLRKYHTLKVVDFL
jgi:HD-GYP domain-containing protein (c-di-GMP phosphodiesterase class II)